MYLSVIVVTSARYDVGFSFVSYAFYNVVVLLMRYLIVIVCIVCIFLFINCMIDFGFFVLMFVFELNVLFDKFNYATVVVVFAASVFVCF